MAGVTGAGRAGIGLTAGALRLPALQLSQSLGCFNGGCAALTRLTATTEFGLFRRRVRCAYPPYGYHRVWVVSTAGALRLPALQLSQSLGCFDGGCAALTRPTATRPTGGNGDVGWVSKAHPPFQNTPPFTQTPHHHFPAPWHFLKLHLSPDNPGAALTFPTTPSAACTALRWLWRPATTNA